MHRWLQGELDLFIYFLIFVWGSRHFHQAQSSPGAETCLFPQWSQRPELSQPHSWEHLAQLISPSPSFAVRGLFPAIYSEL